jgi:hypothetical protein
MTLRVHGHALNPQIEELSRHIRSRGADHSLIAIHSTLDDVSSRMCTLLTVRVARCNRRRLERHRTSVRPPARCMAQCCRPRSPILTGKKETRNGRRKKIRLGPAARTFAGRRSNRRRRLRHHDRTNEEQA